MDCFERHLRLYLLRLGPMTPIEVCAQHLTTPPTPPSDRVDTAVPDELEAIIMHCLEKDPSARPQSARELLERLEACRGVDQWSADDARLWWAEHEEVLESQRSTEHSTEFADTIAVDRAGKRAQSSSAKSMLSSKAL